MKNSFQRDIHILKSYSALRWTISIFGLLLPPILVIGGIFQLWWLENPLSVQTSLSVYYHAGGGCLTSSGVYRDLFVGILCVISLCLIMYSGTSPREDILLDIAGFFLILVALFPTDWLSSDLMESCENFQPFMASKLFNTQIPIHFLAAVLFFIVIAVTNYLTAYDSINLITNDKKADKWRKIFDFARFSMPAFLLLGGVIALIWNHQYLVLGIEWGGIWGFAFYWILKTIEIIDSKVDIDIIRGKK